MTRLAPAILVALALAWLLGAWWVAPVALVAWGVGYAMGVGDGVWEGLVAERLRGIAARSRLPEPPERTPPVVRYRRQVDANGTNGSA